MTPLTPAWLTAHPLPALEAGADKNSRGRVLAAGGAHRVPGALRLTAEAAFRAGAGKVQIATVAAAVFALGIALPEAAVIALDCAEEGELGACSAGPIVDALPHCDALILGPGMGDAAGASALLGPLLADPRDDLAILLDAAALPAAADHIPAIRAHGGRVVLTPHHGEMARLLGCEPEDVAADPARLAADAARDLKAVIALKGGETFVASPDGPLLHYDGGGVGLATGGSGDVLAGVIGGLLSRGAAPLTAAAWGVWLHGEAGRALADRMAPIGFLAHELLAEIPRLMAER